MYVVAPVHRGWIIDGLDGPGCLLSAVKTQPRGQ